MSVADYAGLGGTAIGTGLGGPVGGAIGGGLGSILGGLLGGGPDYNSIFGGLSPTDVQTLINAGQLGGTAYDQINLDPATRAAQSSALSRLMQVGSSGGLDPQSQAALGDAMRQTASQDQARRSAVLQQMAMRGQAGSGAELAASLAGQQQGANANAIAGSHAAADARTRALQALSQGSSLAGNMRGQDYQQAANRAQARDVISQWNAANRVGAYNTNWNQQIQKAQGQAGLAPQQYQRSAGMGGAIGTLAGGAAGYGLSQPQAQPQQQDDQWATGAWGRQSPQVY